MKKYENGYLPKINYWQGKFDVAKEENNTSKMIEALDKLIYFVKRQKEVYGELA